MTHIGLKDPWCSNTPHFSSGDFRALRQRREHPLVCFHRSTRETNKTQGTCTV